MKFLKVLLICFIIVTALIVGNISLSNNNDTASLPIDKDFQLKINSEDNSIIITAGNVGVGSSGFYRGLDKVANKTGLAGNIENIDLYWTRVVGYIIKIALSFLSLIFVVNMVTSGYLWLTAGGNSEQITKARKRIINSVIGMAIVLGVWSITDFLLLKLACIIEFGGPSCS